MTGGTKRLHIRTWTHSATHTGNVIRHAIALTSRRAHSFP